MICAAVLVLTVISASADELQLTNGDRYSGTVVQLRGGTLTFKTSHGTLTVPWALVTGLTIDDEIVVTLADGKELTMRGGTIDPANTQRLNRPEQPITMSGGAGIGTVATGGNTSGNSLRLNGDAVLRVRANRYTISGDVNRAEDRGVTTAQNWTVSARYERFLTPRMFINATATFTDDRFRDLDLRAAYGAGVGYQVIDARSVKMNLDAGLGYVNENFAGPEDNRYSALREAAKLEVILVADRVVLFHQQDGYFGVTGDNNFFVQTQNGVHFTVVGGLMTTIRLDLDYDRSPAPGRRHTDREFALTLGYRF